MTRRKLFESPERLTTVHRWTQYAAIALSIVAGFFPVIGFAAAALGSISFWASTRRDAFKDSATEAAEQAHRLHEEQLRKQNEQLKADFEQRSRQEQRKREELEFAVWGNVIRR